MKKNVIITGIIISTFGLTAFSFIHTNNAVELKNIESDIIPIIQVDTITKQFGFEAKEVKMPTKKNQSNI